MINMHAVWFSNPGGPEVLQWKEYPEPLPGPGEVLIAVHTAGVNNADLMQRQGQYPPPAGASPVLGLECSGVVEALGDGVTSWSTGDRVCALISGGAYAEKVVVPADQLLPLPRNLGMLEAAAMTEAACTVFSNLGMNEPLTSGMSLLVQGGGSGIGTFAIQWAKALGATVFVTAGSEEKCRRCLDLGARSAINYRREDFSEAILRETQGRGVDRILDIVGADYLERHLKCLAHDGRLVIIGSMGVTRDAVLGLRQMMVKRLTVAATTLRARPQDQKAAIVRAVRDHVWPLIEGGRIVPVIDKVFSMTDAAAAHSLLASGSTVGKVLLTNPRAT
jgi:putative PIG3 family NAD(P)H quinone oxidoreductase